MVGVGVRVGVFVGVAVEVLVGAGAYVGVAWSLHHTRLRAFYMRLRVARAAV